MWARIHLIPALQAEEDRDQVRRYLADKAREKELLGTETRVYNSDRFVFTLFYAWGRPANPVAGSCGLHLPSRPRTRQSRESSVESGGDLGGTSVHIRVRRVGAVGMVPLVAVPHRKMHDN